MAQTSRFSIAAVTALVAAAAGRADADPCRTDEVAAFFAARGFATTGLEIASWSPGAGQSGATFCRAIVAGKLFVVKYFLSEEQCKQEDTGYRTAMSEQERVMVSRDANSGYAPTGATAVPAFVRHMFTPYLGRGPVTGTCGFTVSAMAPGSRVSDLVADPAHGLRAARALGTYVGLLHRKTASAAPQTEPLELSNWIAINPPDPSLTNLLYSELDGVFVVDWAQRGSGTRTVDALLASILNQIGTSAVSATTAFDHGNTTQRATLIQALRVASVFWEAYIAQITRPVVEAPMSVMERFEGVTTGSMSIPISDTVWASFHSALVRFKHAERPSDPLQATCKAFVRDHCRVKPFADGELCGECERFLD